MRTSLLLLSYLGLAAGEALKSCDSQDDCISFFTYEEPVLECNGKADVCQYKICVQLNTTNTACVKDAGEPILYTCSAEDTGCYAVGEEKLFSKVDVTSDNSELLVEGGEQCQVVVPGGAATFVFADGGFCEGSVTKENELSCAPSEKAMCGNGPAGKECVWTVYAPESCSEGLVHSYKGSGNEVTLVLTANLMPETSNTTFNLHPVTDCTADQNLTIVEELTNGYVDFLQNMLPEHDMRLLEFDTYAECPQYVDACSFGEKCLVYCTTVQIEFEANNMKYLEKLTESAVMDHEVKIVDDFRKIVKEGDLPCLGDSKKLMIDLFVEPASGGAFLEEL